jgi:hypothetical protein
VGFELVLERVSGRDAGLERDELPGIRIQLPTSDIDSLVSESSIYAVVVAECNTRKEEGPSQCKCGHEES